MLSVLSSKCFEDQKKLDLNLAPPFWSFSQERWRKICLEARWSFSSWLSHSPALLPGHVTLPLQAFIISCVKWDCLGVGGVCESVVELRSLKAQGSVLSTTSRKKWAKTIHAVLWWIVKQCTYDSWKSSKKVVVMIFPGGVGENEKDRLQMLREWFLKGRFVMATWVGMWKLLAPESGLDPSCFTASGTVSVTLPSYDSSGTQTLSSSLLLPSSSSIPICTAPVSRLNARWSWMTSLRTWEVTRISHLFFLHIIWEKERQWGWEWGERDPRWPYKLAFFYAATLAHG